MKETAKPETISITSWSWRCLEMYIKEKQKKTTRDRIRRAQRLGEDLIREDLCDADDISVSQEHDTPGSPSPYDASVSQTTKERLSLTLRAPKMKLLPSVFSSLNSRVKIFVFVANSRRHFSIFM